MSDFDVINPSVQVEAARVSASTEAMSRAMKGAGLLVDREVIATAQAKRPRFWRTHAQVIGIVDSLHWLLPYLR